MPPPMHMVTTIRLALRRRPSISACAVSRVPDVRIGCVYSRDEGRAAEFAAQLGVGSSASDLDAVLGDPGIDAIYVASPNSVHAAQAAQALRAGKHVLVEKPAVTDLADWDALVSLAAQNGVVVLEAIRTRFDPGLVAVAELLPTVGVLRKVSLRYEKRSSRYDQVLAGEVPNIFDPRFGGGALNDLGIYVIHALLSLLGPPDHVVAMNVPIRTGVDGLGTILASYPGFVADLHYRGNMTTGAGRPGLDDFNGGVIDPVALTSSSFPSSFAASGRTFGDVRATTHQISLSVPIR